MITIATRGSMLALWQANHVKDQLLALDPALEIELNIIKTTGDKIQDVSLAKVGGKGLFVKEIENALLNGSADIAVHSMKDVPFELPEGLEIASILEREDPRDAFLSVNYSSLQELPSGANIGTSSLRRTAQLKKNFPIETSLLRGNVDTRVRKLKEGQYDAIILAAAGLKRLEMGEEITQCIDPEIMIPSPGQGAVGIECRSNDETIKALIAKLNHQDTSLAVIQEREFNETIGGSCQVPAGCHVSISGDEFNLKAFIADADGDEHYSIEMNDTLENLPGAGKEAAQDLLDQGGQEILKALGIGQ